VHASLRYLYGFNYADGVDLPQMVFNAQVYALADKYDILALTTLAAAKFEELAKAGWNTTDFLHSIKVIYESTPPNDRLRDVALRLATENADALKDNELFQRIIGEVAEFRKSLAHELSPQLRETLEHIRTASEPLACFQCYSHF
jgi:speckle-type POZ protein